MSDTARQTPGTAPPVNLADPLAVLAYGHEALDASLEPRLAEALGHADAAALVARLDELRLALQAGDPRRIRRGTGLVGRLLGRDVLAEHEAEALRARIGVLVANADRSAQGLEALAVRQQRLRDELAGALARLDAVIAPVRQWLGANPGRSQDDDGALPDHPRERLQRRLDHLATVRASWDIGAGQLDLLRGQNLDLLARYRRVRDVLLPAWRQQALADAAVAGAGRAAAAADAQAAIASEVAAMAGTLDARPASAPATGDSA